MANVEASFILIFHMPWKSMFLIHHQFQILQIIEPYGCTWFQMDLSFQVCRWLACLLV